MPLNPTLIDQINTPVHGTNAHTVTGFSEPGIASADTTLDVSGDSFFDPSAALGLTPEVFGGSGSSGTGGAAGTTEPPNEIVLPPTSEGGPSTLEYDYFGGGAGGPGAQGGASGGAVLTMLSDVIGSTASPYGGTVTLSAQAEGADAGAGGSGATGGSGGESGVIASPPQIDDGAAGGAGGNGDFGGIGGAATVTLISLSEVATTQPTLLSLVANGGSGGEGGNGGQGGGGGDPSFGGSGGAAGDGGAAMAVVSDSNISDQAGITIDIDTVGGFGGRGGVGEDGGAGDDNGRQGFGTPYTEVVTFGSPGDGGAGGASGASDIALTGNTLTGASATLNLYAESGSAGRGETGGPAVPSSEQNETSDGIVNVIETVGQPAGATGATGTIVPGLITVTNNVASVTANLTLAFKVDGTLDGGAGGNLVFSGNSFSGNGTATLDVSRAGTGATIDDANGLLSLAGSAGNAIGGFAGFVLADGDTFDAGAGNPQVVMLPADADTIVLTPGHAAVTLQDATSTNLILQFQGYGTALDSLAQLQADTVAHGENLTIDVAGNGAVVMPLTDWVAATDSVTFAPACFAEGTRIATPAGPVAVEALAVGDRVLTASGAARQVRWVGWRRVACARHPHPEKLWPVRIAAGAFGGGLPSRDLFLSPDHAVFLGGALVPVRLLANGDSIAQMRVDSVAYWHVELPGHDVLLAEGLPCESFLDTGQRGAFEGGGPALALHPDFSARAWDAEACAPLALGGAALERARARVRAVRPAA